MTTLALPRPADAPGAFGRLAAWALRLHGAVLRRAIRRATAETLSQLDARTLRDIGLSRDDVPGTAAALAQDLVLQLSLR